MNPKKDILLFVVFLIVCQLSAQSKYNIYVQKLEDYRYSKYLDSTKIYFRKALVLAKKQNDSLQIFNVHKLMGDGYEHHQKLDSTLYMYAICERFIPKNNLKLKAFLLNDKGFTYSLLNDYETETQLRLQALQLAQKINNKIQIANISVNLAEAYSKLNLNATAKKYFLQAITLSKSEKQSNILHQAYRYYGIHQLKTNQLNKAFTNLNLANAIVLKGKDSISMAFNWRYLAEYYFKKNQNNLGFQLANKSEKIWKARAENRDLSELYLLQADNYVKVKNFKKAKYYYSQTEKLLLNDLYFNEKFYSNFAQFYSIIGNNNLAYLYLKKAKNAIEKLKENEKISKVASLNIKFDSAQKDGLIKETLQKKQLANLELQKKSNQLQIILIILLFTIISVVIISFFYKKIDSKNKELNNLVIQKQYLIKEVHHRVKNNLTTLNSLLFLQAKNTENLETKQILTECQNRIQSMALIQQNLHNEFEGDQVNFDHFLEQLIHSLETLYQNKEKNIEINYQKNNIVFDVSKGIFLGLILNELITNSFKYAFENRNEGKININISNKNNQFIIEYYDNGCGIKDGFNDKNGGFGFKIIRILIQQIKGKLEYDFANNRSTFTITI